MPFYLKYHIIDIMTKNTYILKNPSYTFVNDAKIEEINNNGIVIFSCSGNSESFHFMSETLRGAKMSFAREFGKGKKIIWELKEK